MMHVPTFDSGSFRDRSARVFHSNSEVFRTLSSESYDTWCRVSREPFFKRLMSSGKIVDSRELTFKEASRFEAPDSTVAILQHERIPFVSYPYEWSFGMLRQAALLHLKILTEALSSGFILKDASPYNVQFCGTRPIFIDVGSFAALAPDEPWVAYRQFCELMLFPLLLQAYRHVDFQPVLRGELEGVSARQFLRWLSWRDLFRPGVFSHGWLQATLERHMRAVSTSTVRDLQSSGFSTDLIRRNVAKLTCLVERLEWKPEKTQWTNYRTALPHVAQDGAAKVAFVRSVCDRRRWPLVWDLGCNDGQFSRIAAETADTVVAMDRDHGCVERLYRSLHDEHSTNILPLCVNLANLSPAMGWRGLERKRLEDRGRPDLVLCLGLIHHLVIGHNIPLPEVTDWLASLGGEVVIEFPSKQDAMVQALLQNKRDQYSDYSLAQLELALSRQFEIRGRTTLPSGERTLLYAVSKASQHGAP